jgi:phospholipid/cholesterol/gamma-HCH transport system ATP-binding protein
VCIKHMVGLLYPDEGDVLVHGESVPGMADEDLFDMRKKFGVLFQDGALFGSMNLFDNVAFPLRQHTDKGEDEIEDIVMRRLREVGLEGSMDKAPNELSGGMRKRAGIARALSLDPELLFLDEPTAGLDPIGAAAFDQLICELKEALGLTVFLITHDLDTLYAICERVAVLADRKVVAIGTIPELLALDHEWIQAYFKGPRGRAAATIDEREEAAT